MSKLRIHFVAAAEPIPVHGLRQAACCGVWLKHAEPIVIVPDAVVVSIALLADHLGPKMCRECKLIEPNEGYVYFMAEEEEVAAMRRKMDYEEVS